VGIWVKLPLLRHVLKACAAGQARELLEAAADTTQGLTCLLKQDSGLNSKPGNPGLTRFACELA
jgi:hypothetical protein